MDKSIKNDEINRRFLEVHILVDKDWIEGCVDYFVSENQEISKDNLCESALQQWPSCVPVSLA